MGSPSGLDLEFLEETITECRVRHSNKADDGTALPDGCTGKC